MKLSIATTSVFLLGAMYLGFGIALFFSPQLLSHAELTPLHPTALMEVRAFYGGLEIGLGLYFLLALGLPSRLLSALQLGALILTFTLLGRIYGGFVDGIDGDYLWIAIAVEAPLWVATLVALFSMNKLAEES